MFVDPPLVDVHAHVFTSGMPLSQTAWSRPDYTYGIEHFLADLDENGVPFGVIAAASLYDDFSDYTLLAGKHARLRSTVIVRPDVEPGVLRNYAANGVVGIRLQLHHTETLPDLDTVEYRRLFYRLRDLDWHVHVLIGEARAPDVLPVLQASGVKLVIDHFGFPAPETQGTGSDGHQAVLRALDTGNAWVKVSAAFRFPDRTLLRAYADDFIAKVGPGRMLWGSDSPFVGFEGKVKYADTLHAFYEIVPDPAVRRAISATGLRLYFF